MTTGKKANRLYLVGAHVWAEYRLGQRPNLYDFVAYDNMGNYFFRRRSDKALLGKTMHQLSNYPGFRPFVINSDYLDSSRLITSDEPGRYVPPFTPLTSA